jgi:cobalt/nickel transport system permease protein
MDPRLRVAAATGLSIVVAVSHSLAVPAAALIGAAFLAAAARLPLRILFRRLAALWIFLLLLWLVLPFTREGAAIGSVGPLTITRPGVLLAAAVSLKSTAILLLLLAFLGTLDAATLGHALERLRAPRKLVHLLLLTYRYIFVIDAEYRRMRRAARLRGFRPGTNLHTYRTMGWLVGMLFVRSAGRADRVAQAMRLRGFTGRFHSLRTFAFTRTDGGWSALFLASAAGLLVLEFHPMPGLVA